MAKGVAEGMGRHTGGRGEGLAWDEIRLRRLVNMQQVVKRVGDDGLW